MSKINRTNLMANLNKFEAEVENLKNREFNYRINRSWPGVGVISEIQCPAELVNAWTIIHKKNNENAEAINALKMNDGTFDEFNPKKNDNKFYGFPMEMWEADMKTKREELATVEKIEKLDSAIDILYRNMSEDDKFTKEMTQLDELIGE